MEPFILKVKKAFSRMISPGDKVLAAVSGGMDSVTLLHFLNRFKEEYQFELVVAHLNHMARGEDSEADARFVAGLGEELGLKTIVDSIDVPNERERQRASFQETARVLRYQFLESVLKMEGGNKIVLGHTADDQVETVLMNFLRGSGLKGLSGMPEERGAIIRPLLGCYRSEVENFIQSNSLAYRPDVTNTQTHYLRNRLRLELIPELENYNPHFKSNILETSRIIKADDEYLEGQVRGLFQEIGKPHADGEGLSIRRADLLVLAPALQKRLLRQAVFFVKGDLRRLSSVHIQGIMSLFAAPRTGKKTCLPGGLTAVCRDEMVEFIKTPPPTSSISDEEMTTGDVVKKLNIPGWTDVEIVGLRFQVQLLSRENETDTAKHPHQACLDADRTGGDILVRFFRPGDRFIPLGMKGSKKLKSFFIDQKIPEAMRRSIPILTTRSGDIIWVYAQRISETYRITDKTRKIILIEGVEAKES